MFRLINKYRLWRYKRRTAQMEAAWREVCDELGIEPRQPGPVKVQ